MFASRGMRAGGALCATLFALACAGGGSAATASASVLTMETSKPHRNQLKQVVVLRAHSGERNRVVAKRLDRRRMIIRDAGARLRVRARSCRQRGRHAAICRYERTRLPGRRVLQSLRVLAGDRNDVLKVTGSATPFFKATLRGAEGQDQITAITGATLVDLRGERGSDRVIGAGGDRGIVAGGAPKCRLLGGPGEDRLVSRAGCVFYDGPGDDLDLGGPGTDTFKAEGEANGADVLVGGDNPDFPQTARTLFFDVVDYGARAGAVEVSLDNVADDGDAGGAEGDNVRADVENVVGGAGDDVLRGSGAKNGIFGGRGDDLLFGLGGDDEVDAADGAGETDTLDCGAGADDLGRLNPADSASGCETLAPPIP